MLRTTKVHQIVIIFKSTLEQITTLGDRPHTKLKESKPRKEVQAKKKVEDKQMKARPMAWICAKFQKAGLKSYQLSKVMPFMKVKCQMKPSGSMMKESDRK